MVMDEWCRKAQYNERTGRGRPRYEIGCVCDPRGRQRREELGKPHTHKTHTHTRRERQRDGDKTGEKRRRVKVPDIHTRHERTGVCERKSKVGELDKSCEEEGKRRERRATKQRQRKELR